MKKCQHALLCQLANQTYTPSAPEACPSCIDSLVTTSLLPLACDRCIWVSRFTASAVAFAGASCGANEV